MSDRKYRHRGYQDDDREERPQAKRDRKPSDRFAGAPRGRGLGKPTGVAFKCARCGRRLQDLDIKTESLCPSCSSPLHNCTNCKYFNSGARFECLKPILGRMESKTKANECRYYQPKTVREVEQPSKSNDPRAAFDALFKK